VPPKVFHRPTSCCVASPSVLIRLPGPPRQARGPRTVATFL
jgi:hypothetical protein